MAIQGQLIQTPTAKASENIINPYMTFNNDFTFDFTSGIGNGQVTISTEKRLMGNASMKVRALNTSPFTVNAGDKSNCIVKTTGIHNIQFQAYKLDPETTVTMQLKVFINDAIVDERTIECKFNNAFGFNDDNWNIYYQSFNAIEDDVISLSWTFQSDTADAIVYLDGFKIESNDQNLQAPTIYSNPPFLYTKWSRLYNFTDTQLLFEDSAINFSLFEGVFESNCGSEILVEGVGFKPTRLNSFFTVNCNFLAKVPSGTTPHIDATLTIGTVYYGDTRFLNKPVDDFQYINISFQIPCNAEFLEFDGAVELTARGNDIIISRRNLTISEQVNSN